MSAMVTIVTAIATIIGAFVHNFFIFKKKKVEKDG